MIKSCLETLTRLESHDLIHNVTFMGGATHFDKEEFLWETILSRTVSGNLNNFWSTGDYILRLYQLSQNKKAIGRRPIFSESLLNIKNRKWVRAIEGEGCWLHRVKNVEIPQIGHFKYNERIDEIMKKVE